MRATWVAGLVGERLDYPSHILDLIEPHFSRDTRAVVDQERSLTYGDLDAQSAMVAYELKALGLQLGDPVLVFAQLSSWAIVGMLGVLRAGGQYVPVDAGFPPARRRFMATASGARLAVVEPGLEVDFPDVINVRADAQGPRAESVRGSLAYTCFTSGSTGSPKGVTISAAALAYSTAARLAVYPKAVTGFLLCSSISFDSSVAGIYWTLASGGCLIIPSSQPADVMAAARAAARHAASHMLMLPTFYDVALRAGLAEHFMTLETVIVAGEECSPLLVQRHFDAMPTTRLYNEYGPTECTVWSAVHECTADDIESPSVPIGRPIPGTTFYIRSVGSQSAVPVGKRGELYIAGPGIAESGLGSAEVPLLGTDSRLYRTGDVVSLTPEGRLHFHGRVDSQLKLGGMRIELSEIEQALASCPGVVSSAIGVAADGRSKKIVGFVAATSPIDRRALRGRLLGVLPAVAVPTRIEMVSQLPTLPNGKVDRTTLDDLAKSIMRTGLNRGNTK